MAYQSEAQIEEHVDGTSIKTCHYSFTINNTGGNMAYGTYLRKIGECIKTGIIDREFPAGASGKLVELLQITGFSSLVSGRLYGSNTNVRVVCCNESFNTGARYSQLYTIYSDLSCVAIMEAFSGTACNFSDLTNSKALDAGASATIHVYYRVSDVSNANANT